MPFDRSDRPLIAILAGGAFVGALAWWLMRPAELLICIAAGSLVSACVVSLATRIGSALRIWLRPRRLFWQCPHCGYDRRGLPPGQTCPECGQHPR
jgi:hypothetical protein